MASAPQPVAAIPAQHVFQLADLVPEDLAQALTAVEPWRSRNDRYGV